MGLLVAITVQSTFAMPIIAISRNVKKATSRLMMKTIRNLKTSRWGPSASPRFGTKEGSAHLKLASRGGCVLLEWWSALSTCQFVAMSSSLSGRLLTQIFLVAAGSCTFAFMMISYYGGFQVLFLFSSRRFCISLSRPCLNMSYSGIAIV